MSQVVADFQVNGLFPSTVGGSGSGVKYFPRLLGSSIGVESTAPSASSAVGQLAVPGNSVLNGQAFQVLVGGQVESGGSDSSETISVQLYANTGTTSSPSYTSIATTGVFTLPQESTPYQFQIKTDLFGTTGSGIVTGTYTANIGASAPTSATVITTKLSGISFSSALPFGLVVGVTFGSSDANNAAALYQFQIVQS